MMIEFIYANIYILIFYDVPYLLTEEAMHLAQGHSASTSRAYKLGRILNAEKESTQFHQDLHGELTAPSMANIGTEDPAEFVKPYKRVRTDW